MFVRIYLMSELSRLSEKNDYYYLTNTGHIGPLTLRRSTLLAFENVLQRPKPFR